MGKQSGKWVFAVHRYETADNKHHVSVHQGGRTTTKGFLKWSKAHAYAKSKARLMGLKQYQIDTPSHPHTMMPVRDLKMEARIRAKAKMARSQASKPEPAAFDLSSAIFG